MSDMGGGFPQYQPTHINPQAPRRRSGGSGPWVEATPVRASYRRLWMILAVLAVLLVIALIAFG